MNNSSKTLLSFVGKGEIGDAMLSPVPRAHGQLSLTLSQSLHYLSHHSLQPRVGSDVRNEPWLCPVLKGSLKGLHKDVYGAIMIFYVVEC